MIFSCPFVLQTSWARSAARPSPSSSDNLAAAGDFTHRSHSGSHTHSNYSHVSSGGADETEGAVAPTGALLFVSEVCNVFDVYGWVFGV